MKFVQLNTALIARTQQPDHTNPNFNTSFHPQSSAPDLVRPSDAPYTFKRWLPLILRTRQAPDPGNPNPDPNPTPDPSLPGQVPPLQTIRLTRAQTTLLLQATEASIPRGEVNRLFRSDLAEEITPLLESRLIFPPQGLFLRLDPCSPKDGVGPAALRGMGDVLLKVVTSVRARNAMVHFLEGGRDEEGPGGVGGLGKGDGESERPKGKAGIELFFLPFDERMASDREYRVFCTPRDGRISGISQYRWYGPWRFQGLSEEEQAAVVKAVWRAAEEVRGLILEEAERRDDEEDRLMKEQGFSFDLFYDEETGRCALVELNTFGVRSACGSCLFQWVEDRRVLYGEAEPEFRVAVDMLGLDGEPGQETVRVSRLDGSDEPAVFRGEEWRAFVRST